MRMKTTDAERLMDDLGTEVARIQLAERKRTDAAFDALQALLAGLEAEVKTLRAEMAELRAAIEPRQQQLRAVS